MAPLAQNETEPPVGNSPGLENLLTSLVEQARALATRLAGDPERGVPCHFCGTAMPLWENLLVQQLAGVPAHVECPHQALEARLRIAGPARDFPYTEFSSAVERRMRVKHPDYCGGLIENQ
jgi:hypothetical protein